MFTSASGFSTVDATDGYKWQYEIIVKVKSKLRTWFPSRWCWLCSVSFLIAVNSI